MTDYEQMKRDVLLKHAMQVEAACQRIVEANGLDYFLQFYRKGRMEVLRAPDGSAELYTELIYKPGLN